MDRVSDYFPKRMVQHLWMTTKAGAKKDAQLHYNSETKAKAAKALADQVK